MIFPLNIKMDWSNLLQVLRDVLTVVGASKLVYEGYSQIKKLFVPKNWKKVPEYW